MLPPTLDFCGAVTYHHLEKDMDVRMFGIDLCIYKEKQDSQLVTENCRILCIFDDGNSRWKLYNLSILH